MFPSEKLGTTIRTIIMVNGYFCKLKTCILEFFNHFKTDGAGSAFKLNFVKNFPSDEPEITIDISQFKPERDLYDVVVDPANHNPDPGIVPRYFITIDHIDAIG